MINRPFHTTVVPPERVPVRDSLFEYRRRRQGVATVDYREAGMLIPLPPFFQLLIPGVPYYHQVSKPAFASRSKTRKLTMVYI